MNEIKISEDRYLQLIRNESFLFEAFEKIAKVLFHKHFDINIPHNKIDNIELAKNINLDLEKMGFNCMSVYIDNGLVYYKNGSITQIFK